MATVIDRARLAWQAGLNAWRTGTYQPEALISSNPLVWDAYSARLWRYSFLRHYYDNTIYSTLNTWVARLRSRQGLYKHIRAVKNPTHRLVELYVAKTYGGVIDYLTGKGGAIPLIGDDELIQPTLQLFRWSNWQLEKSLYVRYGANLGDTVLKVVDNRARQKVYMEVLQPDFIQDAKFDDRGNVTEVTISYEKPDENDPLRKSYLYTEIITKEKYATFKNSEPFAYYSDMRGNPIAEWENEANFVPLVTVNHANTGHLWGACAMHSVHDKVDHLNNLVSYIIDQARKDITPLFLGKKMGTINRQQMSDGKDDINIMTTTDPEADIKTITTSLNMANALEVAKYLEDEIENDLPELSMHRLRQANQQTAPGVLAAFGDAIDRFEEAQGIYDDGLIRAIKMGISIGGMNRYKGFERFGLQDYDKGNLDNLHIGERPIVSDTLTKQQEEELKLRKAEFLARRKDQDDPLVQTYRILELVSVEGVEDAEQEVVEAREEAEQIAADQQEAEAIQRLSAEAEQALGEQRNGGLPEQENQDDRVPELA